MLKSMALISVRRVSAWVYWGGSASSCCSRRSQKAFCIISFTCFSTAFAGWIFCRVESLSTAISCASAMLVSPLEASISSVKLIDFSPSFEKPGTKNPLPGDGDKEVPVLLVLLLLFFPASTLIGLASSATTGFTFGTAPVSFFTSSLTSSFLATGPLRNPFRILRQIHSLLLEQKRCG